MKSNGELSYTITVDDDELICRLIEDIIGLKTFGFKTASDLLKKKKYLRPIGVFVDVNLAQNECGLDIIPELRSTWPKAPILVITGDYQESLIAEALSAGAHDFICKPLRPSEVLARLNARRDELGRISQFHLMQYGDLTLNLRHRILTGPKGRCFPSPREIDILTFLLHSKGAIIDRNSMKRHVWGQLKVSDNALDRKLFEVRKGIREVSNLVEMKTIYGKGILLQLKSDQDNSILLEDIDHHLSKPPNDKPT